ncbi:MAG: cation:proton antiporter subunit C [Spirochaetes bacterium]|nr:cation:proton antiporter subunit C [Spirochaetota bacterium]
MIDFIVTKYNYLFYIVLFLIGFYAIIVKKNLVKKVIGMNIMQTSIILFYVSIGCKKDGTLPILLDSDLHSHAIDAGKYLNPLPHVLMLTAIVVMVATLGVALAVLILMYKQYGTLEEDELLKRIK